MHFRPRENEMIDGRTAIEIWENDRHVATIYAQRAGLHILCATGYELDANSVAIQLRQPTGLHVAFTPK